MRGHVWHRPPRCALISITHPLWLSPTKPSSPSKIARSTSPEARLNVITDPLFYLAAIPAVTFLGLGKGGLQLGDMCGDFTQPGPDAGPDAGTTCGAGLACCYPCKDQMCDTFCVVACSPKQTGCLGGCTPQI